LEQYKQSEISWKSGKGWKEKKQGLSTSRVEESLYKTCQILGFQGDEDSSHGLLRYDVM